jgi:hypothetical protein
MRTIKGVLDESITRMAGCNHQERDSENVDIYSEKWLKSVHTVTGMSVD